MAGRASSEIVAVEAHGLDELARALPAWERTNERAVLAALVQVATVTARVTELRAPVLTGAFRSSITADAFAAAGMPTARVTEGAGIPYARWLEFGRRRKGGKKKGGRYLPPTARREKRNVKKLVATATQKSIEGYGGWPKG